MQVVQREKMRWLANLFKPTAGKTPPNLIGRQNSTLFLEQKTRYTIT